MFKYGEPKKINTFVNLTRNMTFRTSDKITAKVVPEDIISILQNNSFDTSAFTSSNINASDFSSNNADIEALVVDAISARNDFIKYFSSSLFTNRIDLNESQLKDFMNNLNIPYDDSYFTIALDIDDSFSSSRNVVIHAYDTTILGKQFNINSDTLNIGANFTTFNQNLNNYYGLNFLTDIEGNNYLNSIIYMENLKLNNFNGSLSIFDNDKVRFKDDTTFRNSNIRLINIPDNVNLTSTIYDSVTNNFIEDLNNNTYQDEFYLPIECDKIILHNGNIVNPNQAKDIYLSILEKKSDIENNYRNVINLLNVNGNQKMIVAEFNAPIFLNKYRNADRNIFNPKIYYNGILYLSDNYDKTNDTPSDLNEISNYILKIDTEIFSKRSINLELNDASITFLKNLNIKKSSNSFINLTESLGSAPDRIRLHKETYPDRFFFTELYQVNNSFTNNIILDDNMKINGPNNFGVEYKLDENSGDNRYFFKDEEENTIITKANLENKNGLIGRKQILKNLGDNSTNSTNLIYPFDSETNNNIINNQELKYSTRFHNINDKKNIILEKYNEEINNLDINDLNYRDKKRNIIKKYFFIEPVEKKFVNGIFLDSAQKILTSKSLLSDDFISDLTKNTNRIYYKINGDDNFYTIRDERYKYLNEGNNEGEILFYKLQVVNGIIYLKDIFNYYNHENRIEYIFENSFSINGYVCFKENVHDGAKSAHFKIEGFYDSTQQRMTITPIFRYDDLWNVNMEFEYNNNRIKITVFHNSINQIIVTTSLNVLTC